MYLLGNEVSGKEEEAAHEPSNERVGGDEVRCERPAWSTKPPQEQPTLSITLYRLAAPNRNHFHYAEFWEVC